MVLAVLQDLWGTYWYGVGPKQANMCMLL
jgi:hypothetical protein